LLVMERCLLGTAIRFHFLAALELVHRC
jgi:hypothetical protein